MNRYISEEWEIDLPKPIKYIAGYRVNFRHEGQRYRKQFHLNKFIDASAAAERYIHSIIGNGVDPNLSLSILVEKYLSWAEQIGQKRVSTIRTDRQRLSVFLRWSEENDLRNPRDIKLQHVRKFQEYFFENYPLYRKKNRRITKNAPATWDKYRLILSAFFNWCVQRDFIDANILHRNTEFQVKTQQLLPERVFTPSELNLIFGYMEDTRSPIIHAFFRFLAYTGCRMSEALRITWHDVDLEYNVIKIARETKNRRVRSIPIAKNLRPFLKNTDAKDGLIFVNSMGRKLSHNSLYHILQFTLKACNLPKARLHDFRHTFGATLAQQGVPVLAIKEMMGHSRISSTLIYVHFAPAHLQQEIAKLPF